MINRGDIIWLGVASGVTGGLIGGMMLGIGIAMMLAGVYVGLLLICVGGPASGLIGWLLARRSGPADLASAGPHPLAAARRRRRLPR